MKTFKAIGCQHGDTPTYRSFLVQAKSVADAAQHANAKCAEDGIELVSVEASLGPLELGDVALDRLLREAFDRGYLSVNPDRSNCLPDDDDTDGWIELVHEVASSLDDLGIVPGVYATVNVGKYETLVELHLPRPGYVHVLTVSEELDHLAGPRLDSGWPGVLAFARNVLSLARGLI